MKKHTARRIITFALLLILNFSFGTKKASSYACKYKEDFYKLYHVHYAQTAEDCIENIWYLENACKANFANPAFAFAKIETEEQWEKYRYLFQMHLNLKLIEQHLRVARLFDKKKVYFYDAPYRDEYLRNLETARTYYQACYPYWEEALLWAEKANVGKFKFLFIRDLSEWEDERERIVTTALDYRKTLDRELDRINSYIEKLSAMTQGEY